MACCLIEDLQDSCRSPRDHLRIIRDPLEILESIILIKEPLRNQLKFINDGSFVR